jgi:hypothetical protein
MFGRGASHALASFVIAAMAGRQGAAVILHRNRWRVTSGAEPSGSQLPALFPL